MGNLRRTLILVATAIPSLLHAGGITLTDLTPTYAASAVNCTGAGGPWTACGSNASLDYGTSISINTLFNFTGFNNPGTVGEENFSYSFSQWNAANGSQWTLSQAGAISGLTYSVNQFDAFANPGSGGVTINVNVSTDEGYSGPALETLFWSQALAINYLVTDPPGTNHSPPVFAMDSFSFNLGGSAIPTGTTCSDTGADSKPYCDPIYPFQYGDRHFFDQPTGLYPVDSFRAIALLSSVDYTNRVLTVYDTGVNYGYDLWVTPEPSTIALIAIGLGMVLVVHRRRVNA